MVEIDFAEKFAIYKMNQMVQFFKIIYENIFAVFWMRGTIIWLNNYLHIKSPLSG